MSAVVGVHGISQEQLGRHQLQVPWRQAVSDGFERASDVRVEEVDLDVAYYGDLFLPDQPDGSKGVDGRGDLGLDRDEIDLVLAAAGEVLTEEELDEAVGGESKGFPGLPGPLRRVLAALDRRFGAGMSALFVGELRQVRRYLVEPQLRGAIDARVAAAVDRGCAILVGHSLGSVVALEFLRRHPEHRLRLLVTLGSPLGLRAIRAMLPDPGFGTDPHSPPVPRWVNLWDRRDPVALAGGLGQWWPSVVDDSSVDNGRDPHAAARYLGKRQTGAAILSAAPELAPGGQAP